MAQQQLVEIARALSVDARVLILDEPTAVLSLHEQDNLFAIIARLKEAGLLVLYVSHRLDEIFTVADRVTVLRDGRKVATLDTRETSQAELVRLMIGHEVRDRLQLPEIADERPLLEVTYRSDRGSSTFTLRRGRSWGSRALSAPGARTWRERSRDSARLEKSISRSWGRRSVCAVRPTRSRPGSSTSPRIASARGCSPTSRCSRTPRQPPCRRSRAPVFYAPVPSASAPVPCCRA